MLDNLQIDDNTPARVKAWLDKHGKSLWIALGLAIAITLGYQFYEKQMIQRDVAASKLYSEYQQALMKGDEEPLAASFKKLREDYPKTPYASAVALLEASRAAFDQHYEDAEATLGWVRANGKDFARPLATLRLAQLKFEQKDYDAALALLQSMSLHSASPNGAFIAGAEELRGDIAIAQGDTKQAAIHYGEALAAYQGQDFNNVLLEMKTETYR